MQRLIDTAEEHLTACIDPRVIGWMRHIRLQRAHRCPVVRTILEQFEQRSAVVRGR